jgi:hypothetical protein
VSIRSGGLAWRWLLVLTIAAGLVAMHNFVAMPTPARPMPTAIHQVHRDHTATAATTRSMANLDNTALDHPGDADATAGRLAVASADDAGLGCSDTGGMDCCALGHPCPAIRADPAGLPAPDAITAAVVEPPSTLSVPLTYVPSARLARAPPDHNARLSQLGVWRN